MIEKIITIKNVTKFHDFNYVGDIEFRPLTVIYAENGKGKSSIAAIFRSLSTGDPAPISAKQTIGVATTPNIQIKHKGGVTEFKNQVWTLTLPDIIVFDSHYVTSNIFSGDHISHDHKKNLYYLLIGEKSVQFAKRMEEIDAIVRDIGKQIPDIEKTIKSSCVGNIDIKDFLKLASLPDIDEQIGKQTALLESLKRSLEIQSTPALSPILIPLFDKDAFQALLGKTLSDISEDVEAKFKHHCDVLGEDSETWITNGVDFSKNTNGNCPFCGQVISTSELAGMYTEYFSEEYSRLKRDIQSFSAAIANSLSPDSLINIQKQISDNYARARFWETYVEEKYPDTDFVSLKSAFEQLSKQVIGLLNRKYSSPLEEVVVTEEFSKALQDYENIIRDTQINNAETERINSAIKQKKDEVKIQSFDETQERLNHLQNTKIRHEPFMNELCERFFALSSQKEEVTKEKAALREQLDAETIETMGKHQELLNSLLGNFGAEFKVHKTQTSMTGGKPSVSYSLLINGENIPLGSDETLDKPSFKTTLSDGEKNALAFAFFLAQVLQLPDLENKTVVIDDPITSLDEQRRLCTKQEILKIARNAKQVIVLSHDPLFLKAINDDFKATKPLIIKRSQTGSVIEEWDIETATQSRHQKNYGKLKRYKDLSEGDPIDVALCIRPVLEGYLRVRFPDEFTPKEWLGDFIEKIRDAKDTDILASLKGKIEELSNINDFSKRFHHETDANYSANRDSVTDAELQPWVRRTIEFMRSA